jgi:transposase
MCDLYELDGVDIEDFCIKEDKIVVSGRLKTNKSICHKCGNNQVILNGARNRQFRLPSTGSKNAILIITTHRNRCKNCDAAWWPQMPFTDGKQRMSKSFVNYVLDLLEFATIKDVANYLEITWDTVKDLHKNHLKTKYKDVELKDVKYISIDEISISKGHKYMTVIADLGTGRILYSIEGRKKEDIRSFLKILKKKHLS